MSRYETTDKAGNSVAYGFENALGYFIDIYRPGTINPDANDVIDEKSSFFDGKPAVLFLIQKYGIKIKLEHMNALMKDRAF